MTTNIKINRAQQQSADQKLIDGLTQNQQTLPSFTVGSVAHTTADIIATLQERIKTAETVESTRATWQTAVQANRDERAKTDALISGVRQSLQMMFAGSIDTLAQYGLTPHKQRAPMTPVEKAEAVEKAKATRKARNTMGPKQKAKIKGVVPAPAPVTPPPAPAPVVTPSPAPAAPVTPPRAS